MLQASWWYYWLDQALIVRLLEGSICWVLFCLGLCSIQQEIDFNQILLMVLAMEKESSLGNWFACLKRVLSHNFKDRLSLSLFLLLCYPFLTKFRFHSIITLLSKHKERVPILSLLQVHWHRFHLLFSLLLFRVKHLLS